MFKTATNGKPHKMWKNKHDDVGHVVGFHPMNEKGKNASNDNVIYFINHYRMLIIPCKVSNSSSLL